MEKISSFGLAFIPQFKKPLLGVLSLASLLTLPVSSSIAASLATAPMYITASQPPLIMLTMARDHKLYYEAYNDYSDLNGDGTLDVGYKPANIEYYGYFDSYKCYDYAGGIFTPVAMSDSSLVNGQTVYNKKCTGSGRNYWSGDFLNYVTTSRIDALRKVLYGGYRSTDTASQTILERAFIPQDAHSWGKEYAGVSNDGYDIREYTPLDLPEGGKRHLFANVTLSGFGQAPLMRAITNSSYRIWEWVSIERPVAGNDCATGNNVRASCTGTGGNYAGSPANASEFQTLVDTFATSGHQMGQRSISNIDGGGNPFDSASDYYLDIFRGTLDVTSAGDYDFAVDGDDAVELWIDGHRVVGWYGGHGTCNCTTHSGTVNGLSVGAHSIEFRHQEATGWDSWKLSWKKSSSGNNSWAVIPTARFSGLTQTFYNVSNATSVRTDYNVRVEACKLISGVPADAYFGRESNCKSYSDNASTPTVTYKPTGLLHKYGESNGMFFGLLSGSYDQNTNGGILRKAISSVTNEIETTTGIFKESGSTCGLTGSTACVLGVVGTINRFHITSFNYGDQSYSCGWITTQQMTDGQCEMWGNPLAEMMYEAVRYFSGATAATAAFTTSSSRDDGVTLPGGTTGLPRVTSWTNPFSTSATVPLPNNGPFPICSKPFMMLISDVYPSFDSDSVPGADSNFGNVAAVSINGATLDVSARGQTLWDLEFSGSATSKNVFIGQVGNSYDGAPTPKAASSFGNLRGLAPSDPTRQGSYYAASVAHFARTNDINSISGTQNVGTYSIALSAPLPVIQIPIGTTSSYITVVPFAKSVGGSSISATQGAFQPTNQIVDFYVDTIKNTTAANVDAAVNSGRPYYKFRINYEDVEQGADHDMDAIAVYEIFLNANNTVTIKVNSDYAAGGIMQHMGYVISGTTADGVYLVVRDGDTGYSSDPEYFLDRPKASDSGANSGYHLPLRSEADTDVPDASNFATRTFSANTSGVGATTLRDPLWYAAKFGGFNDQNSDYIPQSNEWDADGDQVPDTYFLVVNPLKLQQQLDKALSKIQDSAGTSAALTSNSFSFQTDSLIYQARFNTDGWSGELVAYPVTSSSIGNPTWQAQLQLADKSPTSRVILTYDADQATTKGIPFRWSSMSSTGTTTLRSSLNSTSSGTADSLGADRVSFLRGEDITGMRTRPRVITTTITGTCSGTYTCGDSAVAACSISGSVTCTPTTKPNRLGDIVNSQAQFVGRPSAGHVDESYAKFSNDYDATDNPTGKGGRTEMVYVGANDGMVHGFSASTGEELLAYIPGEMYRQRGGRWILNKLTESDYGKASSSNGHRYYVDSSPTINDICVDENVGSCPDGHWRSLLVGGLGGGGQGIYALDVTDPASFSESNAGSLVKWEFTDKNDADLGYTIGRPYIVRLCTSRSADQTCTAWSWYVLVNNGYSNTESDGYPSTSGDAALYVLNANTGALVKKIRVQKGDLSVSGPNGLSEIAPVDNDGDGIVDYVYAGDLKGNLWRFNFTSATLADWDVAFTAGATTNPLYVAWDEQTTRARQSITTAPDAILHPNGGILVAFGTGSYMFTGDPLTAQRQTVYGIWDRLDGNTVASSSRANLQQQSVLTATATAVSTFNDSTGNNTYTYRTVSENTVDWASKDGWYLNLPDSGERISYNLEVRGANVLRVTSTVPSTDICASGGNSWEYFVNALTGARLTWSPYVDAAGLLDFGGTSAFASGRRSNSGITPPGVLITKGKGRVSGITCGSAGGCEGEELNLGDATAGRLSWREILSD